MEESTRSSMVKMEVICPSETSVSELCGYITQETTIFSHGYEKLKSNIFAQPSIGNILLLEEPVCLT
jgi:hypothetical protein